MFKEWSLLKIVFYSVASSLLSIFMLFVKRCSLGQHRKFLLLKAHVGFVVLALTSLWSFWEDSCEQGKVENKFRKMMNLTSTGVFALMAMSLLRQLQLGFDVGVTNFLVGRFLVTLMKMNLKLAPVAALFCYLLVNILTISDSLLELRSRGATQRADDHRDKASLKDVEADSDVFDEKKESGELNGAISFRSSENILVLKKYWNDIRSVLSPKNIAKSKQVLFLKRCGCEVRKLFIRKKFKDDTDEANCQDLEANYDDCASDTNEANFQDPEANSDVCAHETDVATFKDSEAYSDDVVAGRELVIKIESGESKEADSLSSSEIPERGLKKYDNDIQNILSPKNTGKSKEERALQKFGNVIGNFFSPKKFHGKLD